MTNYQCYCYGIVAIYNILNGTLPLTSDNFYGELYYLWDLYSEEEIEELRDNLFWKGNLDEIISRKTGS